MASGEGEYTRRRSTGESNAPPKVPDDEFALRVDEYALPGDKFAPSPSTNSPSPSTNSPSPAFWLLIRRFVEAGPGAGD
eukprot:1063570-Prorocentrum_minimum.AAC.2